MVYQMSFYSENTFLFFSLLGTLCIQRGSRPSKRKDWEVPRPMSVLAAAFCWGMSTLTRSTGIIHSLFIAYFMLNKMLLAFKKGKYAKLVRYVALCLLTIVIMFTPLIVVVYWRPYILHCQSRPDGPTPPWCTDTPPSLYKYIQFWYWDNRFLSFLYRNTEHIIVSLPTNAFLFYSLYRMLREQKVNLLTLSLLDEKIPEAHKS